MPDIPCAHLRVTPLIVRPRDMDADRNVSNAVYFEYLHQSRLEHLARLGLWKPRGSQVFALAENTCRYLAPSFYGDVLSIWTATHAVGQSSFQLVYQIWRQSDETLIAAAHSVQVWLDGNQQSTLMPVPVQEGLTASLCTDLPKMPPRN